MRRTKNEVYLHYIWRTYRSEPLVNEHVERPIYRCIEQQARQLGCDVLAVNGMPNHVHLVVKPPTTASLAAIAKQVKGVSSTFARDQLMHGNPFGWQDHYGVFSVSPRHVQRVVDYVKNQKQHHADGTLIDVLEETDEETPDRP